MLEINHTRQLEGARSMKHMRYNTKYLTQQVRWLKTEAVLPTKTSCVERSGVVHCLQRVPSTVECEQLCSLVASSIEIETVDSWTHNRLSLKELCRGARELLDRGIVFRTQARRGRNSVYESGIGVPDFVFLWESRPPNCC